jgi:hypothetical protein
MIATAICMASAGIWALVALKAKELKLHSEKQFQFICILNLILAVYYSYFPT